MDSLSNTNAESPERGSRFRKLKKTGENWQKFFHTSDMRKPAPGPNFKQHPKPITTHKIKLLLPSKPWLTLPGYWRKKLALAQNGRKSLQWSLVDSQGISKEHLKDAYTKPLIAVSKELLEGLLKEADSGSAEAQYALAECYRLGIGFLTNPGKAFHYCELAANQGLADAQMMLGRFLEDGFGCTQSFEMAYKYYQLASDQGNQSAKNYLGLCCKEKIEFECIPKDILCWYETNIDENDRLGINYFNCLFNDDINTANTEELAPFTNKKFFALAKAVANEGDENMQLFVALCYAVGRYEAPSIEHCFHYLALAAEKNFPYACLILGAHFYNDEDNKIREKAMYYLEQLANQENEVARMLLGQILLEQNQIDKAIEQFALVNNSCTTTYIRAENYRLLGVCYEKGVAGKKSTAEAYSYYFYAAQEGNLEALYRLAKAYFNGELDLAKDVARGLGCYQLAAEKDHVGALLFLANAYDQGTCVEKSNEKANFYATKFQRLIKFRGR